MLPTVWFRNTWGEDRRVASRACAPTGPAWCASSEPELGEWVVHVYGADAELLFTENETNAERIWGDANATPYVKDGINDHVVARPADRQPGAGRHEGGRLHRLTVPAGGEAVVDFRLRRPTRLPSTVALRSPSSPPCSSGGATRTTSSMPRSRRPASTRTRRR